MNFSQRNFPWVSKDVVSRIPARTSARRILQELLNTTSVMYKPSNARPRCESLGRNFFRRRRAGEEKRDVVCIFLNAP